MDEGLGLGLGLNLKLGLLVMSLKWILLFFRVWVILYLVDYALVLVLLWKVELGWLMRRDPSKMGLGSKH